MFQHINIKQRVCRKHFLNALLQPYPETDTCLAAELGTLNFIILRIRTAPFTGVSELILKPETWPFISGQQQDILQVSDDHWNVKVLSTGHQNYESTKDLGCSKGCQQRPLFTKLILQSLESFSSNWWSAASPPWPSTWEGVAWSRDDHSVPFLQTGSSRDVQKCPHTHTAPTAAQKHPCANSLRFPIHIKFYPPVKTQLRPFQYLRATMKTEHSSL